MGRPARYIPENKNGVLVEVSCRAIGGRALLTPGPNPFKFNELVVGVIGRALEISPLELCSVVFASNHWHGLLVVQEQQNPYPLYGTLRVQSQQRDRATQGMAGHDVGAPLRRHRCQP